jgi:hypothetical protein
LLLLCQQQFKTINAMKPTSLFIAWLLATLITASEPVLAQALPRPIQTSIDSLFKTWDTGVTPGAVVAVIREGQVVYQRSYGMAHIGRREKLTASHSFWVASMSKQFTAMSIALLAGQGKISLEDDIRLYLPQLPDLGDTVRIRHLLDHTSGLRDGFTLIGLTFKGEQHYTNENVVAALARQKSLNFKPGIRYEYLDSGYADAQIAAPGCRYHQREAGRWAAPGIGVSGPGCPGHQRVLPESGEPGGPADNHPGKRSGICRHLTAGLQSPPGTNGAGGISQPWLKRI